MALSTRLTDTGLGVRADIDALEVTTGTHTTELAQIAPIEPNHYYVGASQKYTAIAAAVAAWTAAGKPASIIHISKGVYNEKINLGGLYSALSFIGESKESVIWKQTTGYYPDCPLSISGDVLIKNITFIADTTDNPGYTYTAYTSGNTGAAYGLHLDAPNAAGVVQVENCNIYSYQNAAIGSGTCQDRELRIINCHLYSYSAITETKIYGALLYHGDSGNGVTGQKLVLKHNLLYADASPLALYLQNVGDTNVAIELVANTLASGAYTTNDALVTATYIADFNMDKNSCGNNVERLNYADSSWQKAILTASDGSAILNVSDFDTVRSGVFKGNSALGTANTPVAGHAFLGIAFTYTTALYTVQYAWDCDASFKMYMRTWASAAWSAWAGFPSATEMGYVAGVTSAIQTQITAKLAKLLEFSGVTTSFTLTTGYPHEGISVNTSDAVVVTIPLNATSAHAVGRHYKIYRRGTGTVTFAPESVGVTIESSGGKLAIANRYEVVELIKIGTDTWILHGSLA